MIRNHFVKLLSLSLITSLLISSCQEEDVATGEPSTVYFQQSDGTSYESGGLIKIPVYLDMPQNAETLVQFNISGNALVADNFTQNPDYELITESPLSIPKGESMAYIEVRIIEDQIFEQEFENFSFQLERIVDGNASLSGNSQLLSYTHEIIENEYQLKLEWDQAEGSDLNMFVELPNKSLIEASGNSGIEELTVINVKDQEQYYLDVWYEGEASVAFQLKSLQAGVKEARLLLSSSFNPGNEKTNASEAQSNSQNYLLIKDGGSLKILN